MNVHRVCTLNWSFCNEPFLIFQNYWKRIIYSKTKLSKMAFQRLCSYKLREFLAMLAQFTMLMVMIWTTTLSITDRLALPGGHIFSLLVLFTSAVAGGYIFSRIYLPPLLGMLNIRTKEYWCWVIFFFNFIVYAYENSYLVFKVYDVCLLISPIRIMKLEQKIS